MSSNVNNDKIYITTDILIGFISRKGWRERQPNLSGPIANSDLFQEKYSKLKKGKVVQV